MECSRLTHLFPFSKTLASLADQMDRSARSGKQNIVEGWKRNSTKEYYDFLGFSIGAIAELEEDCKDIWYGVYPELLAAKGIMGEMGINGSHPAHPEPSSSSHSLSSLSSLSSLLDIEKLRFYPLDQNLPPIIQLKLRCEELNFLLEKLQKSLLKKMSEENTLPRKDKFFLAESAKKKEEFSYEAILEEYGLKRSDDGKIIKK